MLSDHENMIFISKGGSLGSIIGGQPKLIKGTHKQLSFISVGHNVEISTRLVCCVLCVANGKQICHRLHTEL